jgi:hypothetical protein
MGDGAADEHRMEHAGKDHVGDELPLAPKQPLILAPQDRTADEAVLASVGHDRSASTIHNRQRAGSDMLEGQHL